MSMAKTAMKPEEAMSLEEFLKQGQDWPGLWEYVDGRPLLKAMVNSHAHGVISVNLTSALDNQLQNHPCQTMNSDKKFIVVGKGYQPDIGVDCGEPDEPQQENVVYIKPVLVIEITSKSNTTPYKNYLIFQNKINDYKLHIDIQYIMIIDQFQAFVEFWHRPQNGDWQVEWIEDMQATIHLPLLNVELAMEKIYRRVKFVNP